MRTTGGINKCWNWEPDKGLTSCVLATLGCKRVVCTDTDITHALQTVARNADVLKAKPEVVRAQLGVGAPPSQPDVIVCGDCFYNRTRSFVGARFIRLRVTKHIYLFMWCCGRGRTIKLFLRKLLDISTSRSWTGRRGLVQM